MAKPVNDGEGTVVIPAEDVNKLLVQATQLNPPFFVAMGKVKVLSDGSLQGNYTYSSSGAPPPPPAE
jgi:hypothetical protein